MSVQDYNKLEYDLKYNCFTVKQLKKIVEEVSNKLNCTNFGYCEIVLTVKFNDRNTSDFYEE